MLMPNIDIHSVDQMISAGNRYPGICYPMIGLHPTSVREDYGFNLKYLEELCTEHKFMAIGEIGIDLYWDKTYLKEQIVVFSSRIELLYHHDLPVVIHARDSFR